MDVNERREQLHPRRFEDRAAVDRLLSGEATAFNLGELARLRVRYRDFPGEPEIRRDLDRALELWNLSEAELFARTRELHQNREIYRPRSAGSDDWS